MGFIQHDRKPCAFQFRLEKKLAVEPPKAKAILETGDTAPSTFAMVAVHTGSRGRIDMRRLDEAVELFSLGFRFPALRFGLHFGERAPRFAGEVTANDSSPTMEP